MALGGLWHGASWSFVVWGIYHGLALVIHKEFQGFKESVKWLDKICATSAFRLLSIWMTFNAVCIGNVFFRIQDIGAAFSVVKKMILFRPIFTQAEGHQLLILKPDLPVIVPITMTMVAILVLGNLPWSKLNSTGALRRTPVFVRAVYCSVVIVLMLAFMPDTSAPFIYFQF